jgi:hypothetical protein
VKLLHALLCLIGHSAGAECLTLGKLGYVLEVNEQVEVLMLGLGSVQLNFLGRFSPGLLIQFVPLPGSSGPERAVLENGIVLSYTIKTTGIFENAGPFTTVNGTLNVEPPLRVACISDANESPNPEWCLQTLGRLRPEAMGCETKEN